jgi:hypothetical protein
MTSDMVVHHHDATLAQSPPEAVRAARLRNPVTH